ncbi:hypothetical protein [Flavobacterium akiainvivens]|nr:hypothetical protein [Flavobacterium akiainvivens]SFQ71588.1 hypothetical protein SAMN05444144_1179 [Flavobacterium akiainvivens]
MLEYLNLPKIIAVGLVLFIPMLLLMLLLMYGPKDRTKYAMDEIRKLIRAFKSSSKPSNGRP